jgi:asparagine synthase (glutamine-hydrolysing)
MCGILGELQSDAGSSDRDRDFALRSLSHRGPDGHSVWQDEHCLMGHRRLAIIDLSEAAAEPMTNEDGSVVLSFNGEIYNYMELRAELRDLGHQFRSQTDAEVVLHGYEDWGVDVLSRLHGMFAFAIWDKAKQRLFLARDRIGKKPLFYARDECGLSFASELQALLPMREGRSDIDSNAIDAYLALGYVPAPFSGFRGIEKLPPGHFLLADIEPDGLAMRIHSYWSLDYAPKSTSSLQQASAELREAMTEAVRLRLISDVPLGAFLSGGIDSSIVVGLMAQLSSEPVKTFSIGFEEQSYDELTHARRIAEMWETDHHEFVVKPDALAVLPLLLRHYGEPYADSSAIPTYYVAKLTRDHVTVALNGDGGDESFAGYERYWGHAMADRIGRLPGGFSTVRAFSRLIPDSSDPKALARKVRRFTEAFGNGPALRYGRWSGYFSEQERDALLRPEVRTGLDGWSRGWFASLFEGTDKLHPVDAAMSVDVRSYLPFDLLVKVDIATMANSLEARSPFLDQEVMSFAARLPVNMKLRGRTSKYILRKTFADLLPRENVARPKMGFAVPVGQWLRGPLKELLHDTLLASDARTSAYLRPDAVRAVVDRHMKGDERSSQVWNLLMLEMWHREVVDKQGFVSA